MVRTYGLLLTGTGGTGSPAAAAAASAAACAFLRSNVCVAARAAASPKDGLKASMGLVAEGPKAWV
jgi:hypothetical protein